MTVSAHSQALGLAHDLATAYGLPHDLDAQYGARPRRADSGYYLRHPAPAGLAEALAACWGLVRTGPACYTGLTDDGGVLLLAHEAATSELTLQAFTSPQSALGHLLAR